MADDICEPWTNPDEDENGINLARLRYNRSLTDEEKIERHRKAAESVIILRDAAEAARRSKAH